MKIEFWRSENTFGPCLINDGPKCEDINNQFGLSSKDVDPENPFCEIPGNCAGRIFETLTDQGFEIFLKFMRIDFSAFGQPAQVEYQPGGGWKATIGDQTETDVFVREAQEKMKGSYFGNRWEEAKQLAKELGGKLTGTPIKMESVPRRTY